MPYSLEICCYSLQSCISAEKSGANRIELCGGFLEGGLTPSIGLVKQVLSNIKIPVYIMIRPRGGDFCYSTLELQAMQTDIEEMAKLKPSGWVFGVLNENAELNIDAIKALMEYTQNLPLTFHRAFDHCRNPENVILELIDLGFENILTSGQCADALLGKNNLSKYQSIAQNKINIMAGRGVLPENISELASIGIQNFHTTAKTKVPSRMKFRNEQTIMGLGPEAEFFEVDGEIVKNAAEIIKKLNDNLTKH